MPFAISTDVGAAYSLAQGGGYTAACVVHAYPGSTVQPFVVTATIDAPSTAGTGLLACSASASAAVAAGKYSYVLSLIPANPTPAIPAILIYGDLEVRSR